MSQRFFLGKVKNSKFIKPKCYLPMQRSQITLQHLMTSIMRKFKQIESESTWIKVQKNF